MSRLSRYIIILVALALIQEDVVGQKDGETNQYGEVRHIEVRDDKHGVLFTMPVMDRRAKDYESRGKFEPGGGGGGVVPFGTTAKPEEPGYKLPKELILIAIIFGTCGYCCTCCLIGCFCPLACNKVKLEKYSSKELAQRNRASDVEMGKITATAEPSTSKVKTKTASKQSWKSSKSYKKDPSGSPKKM